MRSHPLRVFGSALFIIAGVLLLSRTLSSGAGSREMTVSGAVGLLGVVALGLFGISRRGWLLPLGCALATFGAMQAVSASNLNNFLLSLGMALAGLGALFVGLYLNRGTQWGWLVPGSLLWTMGGLMALAGLIVERLLPLAWVPTLALWLFALQLFVVFAGNRRAWWAFSLAYVLWALGTGLELVQGAEGGAALLTWGLWALALLFWMGYLRDDTRAGRLWLAGGLSVAGALPLLVNPQLGFWLAIGVSAAVGMAWLAAWLRRRHAGRAEQAG